MNRNATYRLLVVSNETVEGDTLHELIGHRSLLQGTEVFVVAPALNSRVRHWLSDEDSARRAAGERLRRALARLDDAGVPADGHVGDADPIQAIEDALRIFPADELIIATHPEPRSNWLAHRLVERAGETLDLPVTHVVVDLAARREHLAA